MTKRPQCDAPSLTELFCLLPSQAQPTPQALILRTYSLPGTLHESLSLWDCPPWGYTRRNHLSLWIREKI